MLPPCLAVIVPFLRGVVPNNERVFGEIFDETFGRLAVDIEVERLRDGAQAEEREEGSHDCSLCRRRRSGRVVNRDCQI